MNIEENIKPLKILMSKYKQIDEMNNFDHELALVIDYTELSAIETLLTAYEKEKEENYKLKYEAEEAEEYIKGLKEKNKELEQENREIRDWKYVIDNPIDLDKLRELDLIKIKGKEYIAKDIYDEIEKDKKAFVNNYSNVLTKFISKDKIKPIQIIDLDGKIHNVYKIEEG